MFAACGVPVEKFRAICSAVDKLDKVSMIQLIIFFVLVLLLCNRVDSIQNCLHYIIIVFKIKYMCCILKWKSNIIMSSVDSVGRSSKWNDQWKRTVGWISWFNWPVRLSSWYVTSNYSIHLENVTSIIVYIGI